AAVSPHLTRSSLLTYSQHQTRTTARELAIRTTIQLRAVQDEMSASKRKGDRSRLDGFEIEIFKLVQREATSEQWKQWLRAPL
ncbi:unnamed protein product, partial [Ectocarpus fasciculatus]